MATSRVAIVGVVAILLSSCVYTAVGIDEDHMVVHVEEDTPTSGRQKRSAELPEELHFRFSMADSPVRLRLKRSALVPVGTTSHVFVDDVKQDAGVYTDSEIGSSMIVKRSSGVYQLRGVFAHDGKPWEMKPLDRTRRHAVDRMDGKPWQMKPLDRTRRHAVDRMDRIHFGSDAIPFRGKFRELIDIMGKNKSSNKERQKAKRNRTKLNRNKKNSKNRKKNNSKNRDKKKRNQGTDTDRPQTKPLVRTRRNAVDRMDRIDFGSDAVIPLTGKFRELIDIMGKNKSSPKERQKAKQNRTKLNRNKNNIKNRNKKNSKNRDKNNKKNRDKKKRNKGTDTDRSQTKTQRGQLQERNLGEKSIKRKLGEKLMERIPKVSSLFSGVEGESVYMGNDAIVPPKESKELIDVLGLNKASGETRKRAKSNMSKLRAIL